MNLKGILSPNIVKPYALAITTTLGLMLSIQFISTWILSLRSTAKSEAGLRCSGISYLIYKDANSVFKDRIVALGPPREILSHAVIPSLGAATIADTDKSLDKGLHSVKGSFIYEVANPNIRLLLYKVGLIDTTILPREIFQREFRKNTPVSYTILRVTLGNTSSVGWTGAFDGKKRRILTIGDQLVLSYMDRYFDPSDASGAKCR